MYILVDYHTGPGTNRPLATQFWHAVAPRYANDTNVIYGIQNEPDMSENYDTIRKSKAPSTS
jgi:Cellulase (glycosyl hydrolase family 5)